MIILMVIIIPIMIMIIGPPDCLRKELWRTSSQSSQSGSQMPLKWGSSMKWKILRPKIVQEKCMTSEIVQEKCMRSEIVQWKVQEDCTPDKVQVAFSSILHWRVFSWYNKFIHWLKMSQPFMFTKKKVFFLDIFHCCWFVFSWYKSLFFFHPRELLNLMLSLFALKQSRRKKLNVSFFFGKLPWNKVNS